MAGEFVPTPQGMLGYATAIGTCDGFPAGVTAAVLAAGATLTSSWHRSRRDPLSGSATQLPIWHTGLRLVGYVTADQISVAAPNGLLLDENDDYAQTASETKTTGLGGLALANDIQQFNVLLTGLFFRLRYVNGATVQGSMRLFAWLEGANA